jgi:formylglycine-generating enzyme required for sulfatase activity
MTNQIFTFGGMDFLSISGSPFLMGADDIKDDEGAAQPRHSVDLDYSFYLGRHPVTNLHYARTVKGLRFSADEAEFPAVGISFLQAQAYIGWLNEGHRKELPQGYQFSLPSEAEWEKAARGTDGRVYPWGNEFASEFCNSAYGGFGHPSAVGYYSPRGDSPYGAADMAGNIWEWTRSRWGNEFERAVFKYPYTAKDGREELALTSLYVLRGGSFADSPENARCAVRYAEEPERRFGNIGFRVAVVPVGV